MNGRKKNLTYCIPDRWLMFTVYKESQYYAAKTNDPISVSADELNKQLSKEKMQKANKHLEQISTSLVILKM